MQTTDTNTAMPMPVSIEPVAGVEACAFDPCYEPNVAVDPQGRIFVVDGWTSKVGVSEDGGRTFTQRDPPKVPADMSAWQADVLVQVSPAGRLYWSALLINFAAPTPLLWGIQVAWSDDAAATWAGNVILDPVESPGAAVVYPDRQWLGFGSGQTVYLSYNQIPTGIWLARSDDAGATWGGWVRAAAAEARVGPGQTNLPAGQSGPPVVDADGTVYLPACGAGTTLVFRSTDGGQSFAPLPARGGCNWFPILAVLNDTLTLAVQDDANAIVTVSTDGGTNFSDPVAWGTGATAAPWPLSHANGSLALAWYHGTDATHAELHLARGNATHPIQDRIVSNVTSATAERTPALTDFASAAWMPDGRVAIVWVEGPRVMVQVLPA